MLNSDMHLYEYLSDKISFSSQEATKQKSIYFPLCGTHAGSLKSSITPHLSGDIKVDKNRYLTKPATREDLRNKLRDFYCFVEKKGLIALSTETTKDSSQVEMGLLWHKLTRHHRTAGLKMEALNFIPVTGENVELMVIKITNTVNRNIRFTPTAAVPIFARTLANKHDHEHVTALLHRTKQTDEGVFVSPAMIFNEEGHQPCETAYYVFGCTAQGKKIRGTFPTIESFYGDSSNDIAPKAVIENEVPKKFLDKDLHGLEAIGALRFEEEKLSPGQSKTYIVMMGVAQDEKEAARVFKSFSHQKKIDKALELNQDYWTEKSQSISFQSADEQFNAWMHWVTIQPVLRRIFGCSFLPDHDYGKGGKGWRDLWQDMLSLILIEPENVRSALINNFEGVRIDGTNATIIGEKPGEFSADRNAITRVWMDHGAWPLVTLLLYIDQTGDFDILFEESAYFRDPQLSRTFDKDYTWAPSYGKKLKSVDGKIYTGSILEHVLIQHLVQFFNVGEHNITRLENADWNDGLDMAFERGESVAFMSLYGGNLLALADLLESLAKIKKITHLKLAQECAVLFDSFSEKKINYNSVEEKRKHLFSTYLKAVQPEMSGKKISFDLDSVVSDLRAKGHWIFQHIRKQEFIKAGSQCWFNGYYDNKGKRVEGKKKTKIWMTLTGQVFPIMSGLASNDDIKEVVKSARSNLKDKILKGYRLNTDFGVSPYLDFGRAFGFAFGTKENGSIFSHMAVMYGYSLYKRGFVKEGYDVLQSLYHMSVDSQRSKIYPGIPEYFDLQGRGMYPYLTGSASWLVLAQLTQVFGVRGSLGNLVIEPKLVKEQFDAQGLARVTCAFAGKKISITYLNKNKLDYKKYQIRNVKANGKVIAFDFISPQEIIVQRKMIEKLAAISNIEVTLS